MNQERIIVRRDTPAWNLQVWIAFAVSILLCGVGMWNVEAPPTDRILLLTGYLFCLFTAFTLAKSVRDNQDEQVDTDAWRWQVRIGFGLSVLLTAWSLFSLSMPIWPKGFMVAAWLFMEASAFTLAKTLRDKHDADLLDPVGRVPSPFRSKSDDEPVNAV